MESDGLKRTDIWQQQENSISNKQMEKLRRMNSSEQNIEFEKFEIKISEKK